MKLSAPKKIVWIVAVVLGVLGLAGNFTALGPVSQYSFWLVALGFIILALATLLDGM